MSTTRKRPIEDPTEKRYVNVLGEPITTYKGLQFCQKCGQNLSEKVCVHIAIPPTLAAINKAPSALDESVIGTPFETPEQMQERWKRGEARATLDGIPEQVKNIAESVVGNLKNLDPRVTGAEAAAAIKRQSADIRNSFGTTLADKETVTTNHDDELFDDDKETELPAHLDGMVDDDKETVTTAIKPHHYARGAGGATFDVIEALYQVLPWEQFKGYMKGNIIKYTVRYDDKNGTEDVEKAAEYNRRLMAYEVREGAKNAS